MDSTDAYYIALVLDPRVKGELLKKNLTDQRDATGIFEHVRTFINATYANHTARGDSITSQVEVGHAHEEIDDDYGFGDIEGDMLRQVQSDMESLPNDIDLYFDSGLVKVDVRHDNWLFDWWRSHSSDYPCMSAAARDFLAIPATEVSVERVFSECRGLLNDNRHSLKGNTIRALMLSRDMYKA